MNSLVLLFYLLNCNFLLQFIFEYFSHQRYGIVFLSQSLMFHGVEKKW